MSSSLGNSILIIVLLLIINALMLLIALSFLETKISGIKNSDNKKLMTLSNDFYAIRAINLSILIISSLFFLELFKLFRIHLDLSNILSILIASIGGSLIIIMFSLIPIVRFTENSYEQILIKTNKLINVIKYILIPFTYIYTLVVDKIYKPKKKTMTEDALLVMVDRAEQEFGINENESKLIKSVLDFDELKVLDIYTPRVDLVAISKNATNDEIVKVFRRSGFSRLPVYDENVDDIIGIINHKDFYNKVLLEKKTLNDILSKPLEVTEYMDVSNLLTLLKSNQEHLAVVKDEYGGTLGIVTMEDILEELVGDIWDEHDNVVEAIQLVEENKYLVHGSTYLSDLIDKLELDNLEDDDNVTVNGWITSNLGKIGSAGDSFVYDNLDVKVVTASQKKVFEVIINVLDIKENNEE